MVFLSSSINEPQLPQLSHPSTPQSVRSEGPNGKGRSPLLSDGSGSFENAVQRKKSHPVSDKGYGSTNSVSSGSSNDSEYRPPPSLQPYSVRELHTCMRRVQCVWHAL